MKIEQLIQQLDSAFKGRAIPPSQCITFEKDNLFYIDDNKIEGKCIVVKRETASEENEHKYFKIINENENTIALWAVDGCFFKHKGKRCDCIFFDENDFCFAEFKLNATSLHPKSIQKNRDEALSQLEETIVMMQNKVSDYRLEAYLCTPTNYPDKNNSISDIAIEFLENYGVRLYEQNYKVIRKAEIQ